MQMKNLSRNWGIAAFLMVVFFLYSFWIAPFSIHHGYYVGAAKLMAEGLVPYKDFNVMDFPLGIWLFSLVYRVVGVTTSGNAAVLFLMVIHLVNTYVLSVILERLKVQNIYRWISVLLYVLILYSSDALMVNIEPLAVLFLLLSILFAQEYHSKTALLVSALFMALAVFCKYQVVSMSIAVAMMVLLSGRAKKVHWKACLFYLLSLSALLTVFYVGTSIICQEPSLIQHLNVKIRMFDDFRNGMTYFCILAGRCSIYVVFLGILLFKRVKRSVLLYSLLAILAYICTAMWLFIDKSSAISQFLYPFVIIAFAIALQEFSEKPNIWYKFFYLTAFIIPAFLGIREFQKFDYGSLKAEQQEYLVAISSIITEPSQISVMVDQCTEYELCTQIYSEIPTIRPFDLKHTQWGLVDWEDAPQGDFVIDSLLEADYVVINSPFQYAVDFLSYSTGQLWAIPFNEFMDERDSFSIESLLFFKN